MKLTVAPTHWAEKWVWILLVAFAWLAGMGLSFWDQDEAAYAGFASTMIQTGNWLIPDFLWSEIHRKPPLLFWSIAGAFELLGMHEWTVRLPSLLALLGTVLLLRYQAAVTFGTPIARLAAWMLAANIFLPHLAKLGVTDALLLFFETLAALSLVNFFHQPQRRHQALFVLGTAGALLTKGPPVLILTFGMLGLILLFSPERKLILKFHPWLLFPLAAIPLFVWGRLAWMNDGGILISWMVDWYTLRRVGSDVLGQTGPPGYHLLVLAIGFLPMLALLPGAFGYQIRQIGLTKRPFKALVLIAWAMSGWVIYEIMKSKLPTYAIGAYPGIALMLGSYLHEVTQTNRSQHYRLHWGIAIYMLLSLALAIALPILVKSPVDGIQLFPQKALPIAYLMAIALLIPAIGVSWLLAKSQHAWAFRGMLLQSALFLLLAWQFLVPSIEPQRGATKKVAAFAAANNLGLPVLLTDNFQLPSLPMYLVAGGTSFEEASNPDAWLAALTNKKQLLVLNSSNIQALSAVAAKANCSYRIEKEIPGFVSDRGKFTTWYLVRGQ